MKWGAAELAAAWSAVAEPGDIWAGALRRALGNQGALEWALAPFTPPPVEAPAPTGNSRGWLGAHKRWQPRLSVLNPVGDLEQLARLDGQLVLPGGEAWPAQLDDLEDACPPALWVLGETFTPTSANSCVSVVGARAATSYGVQTARNMSYDLAKAGVTIVSGGAYGIDAAAHRGALDRAAEERAEGAASTRDAGQATTVAIVCGGLQELYPAGNETLFRQILGEGGSIVAEVPPSYRPARWRFLERNRLIAAWSAVTVVVEAGLRSGALASANRAADLGREVAAVPGPVTSFASAGPHQLIRDGAALVECGGDVLELGVGSVRPHKGEPPAPRNPRDQPAARRPRETTEDLDPLTLRVWEALPLVAAVPESNVTRASGLSGEDVHAGLSRLSRRGMVHQRNGLWKRSVA